VTTTRERLAKVEALAAGSTTPGERDAAHAASLRLRAKLGAARQVTDPYLSADEVAEVLQHLDKLGYTFVSVNEKRSPGARYLENDDALHGLYAHLLAKTPMRRIDSDAALGFWRRLIDGYHIAEPAIHPSGHRSQEHAYTTVTPLGAGTHTSPRKR
jgi:hypothetical protein